jgi:DNA adenine methylase
MKTLLRYPGGKAKAVKILEKYIPKDTKNVVSPFFGGGSLEFALADKGVKVEGYDVFKPVVNFWKVVKYQPADLVACIRKFLPITKEKFLYLQQILREKNENLFKVDAECAAIFFILNRCSFSGTTLSGGYSKEANAGRLTDSSIEKILSFNSQIDVFAESFEEVIPNAEGLLFCDPPYYLGKKSNLYGNSGDTHKDFNHELLAELLKKKNNWILCYNNDPYIRSLYKDYQWEYPNWKYGMSLDKCSKEILIICP